MLLLPVHPPWISMPRLQVCPKTRNSTLTSFSPQMLHPLSQTQPLLILAPPSFHRTSPPNETVQVQDAQTSSHHPSYGLVQPGGRPDLSSSRRTTELSKPLPCLPAAHLPNAEQSFLATSDNGTAPFTLAQSSSLIGGLVDHRAPPLDTLPPQHIPRPVDGVSSLSAATASASAMRTPPKHAAAYEAVAPGVGTLTMPASVTAGPFSPPDSDPHRSLMDSNRNSIDDIRRNHAARAARRQSGDLRSGNGLVADPTFTPTRAHTLFQSEAAAPAASSPDPAQRHRRAMASEPPRPASVLETRAARMEAVQRHQQHSRVDEGSSDTFDATDTFASSRDTQVDRASQQQLQLRAVREQERERERQYEQQQQQIREQQRQRERERVKEKEREREREREKEKERGDRDRDRDRERRSRRLLGDYALGKTLGAGSMGKVKLGVKMGNGEKVAIKIIPRHTSMAAAQSSRSGVDENGKPQPPTPAPTASFLAKAAAKDQSKEIRTIREGSLQILLHHPYVCGMREMMIHTNHYYMVFEYVNGGQMLDYIISHGRLRERSARKFARQIGSALGNTVIATASCIVISRLRTSSSPRRATSRSSISVSATCSRLIRISPPSAARSTLLHPSCSTQKVYTGPEVDVWSFGIVLYVLVCGKVPFDDQSMPALHAKIKRGQVEYPAWLSGECKHILSRMLVTNPANRATLSEVLSHPWMVKGYDGAPDPHLPERTPLRPHNIDPEVIKGMTGFEFGTPETITANLVDVLTSEAYQASLNHWELKNLAHGLNGLSTAGNSGSWLDQPGLNRLSTRGSFSATSGSDTVKSKTGSRRFSGIDFYKKKLTSNPLAAAFGSKDDSALGSANGSSNGLGTGLMPFGKEPLDPTRGFHPLISIYFLVKEKMEREKLYGHSFFASSNLSLNGTPLPPPRAGAGPGTGTGARAASAGAMPTAADIPQEALRVPEAPHVSHRAYDPSRQEAALAAPAPPRQAAAMLPVPASPTPVFDSREKSKPMGIMAGPPRARANAEDLEAALREKGLPSPGEGTFAPSISGMTPVPAASTAGKRQSFSMAPAGAEVASPQSHRHSMMVPDASMSIANNHKRSVSLTARRPPGAASSGRAPPIAGTGEVAEPEATVVDSRRMSTVSPARSDRRASYVATPSKSEAGTVAASPTPAPAVNNTSSTLGYGATLARRFSSFMSRSPSQPLDADSRERKKQSRLSMPLGGLASPQSQQQRQRRNSTHMPERCGGSRQWHARGCVRLRRSRRAHCYTRRRRCSGQRHFGPSFWASLGDMPISRNNARNTRQHRWAQLL